MILFHQIKFYFESVFITQFFNIFPFVNCVDSTCESLVKENYGGDTSTVENWYDLYKENPDYVKGECRKFGYVKNGKDESKGNQYTGQLGAIKRSVPFRTRAYDVWVINCLDPYGDSFAIIVLYDFYFLCVLQENQVVQAVDQKNLWVHNGKVKDDDKILSSTIQKPENPIPSLSISEILNDEPENLASGLSVLTIQDDEPKNSVSRLSISTCERDESEDLAHRLSVLIIKNNEPENSTTRSSVSEIQRNKPEILISGLSISEIQNESENLASRLSVLTIQGDEFENSASRVSVPTIQSDES